MKRSLSRHSTKTSLTDEASTWHDEAAQTRAERQGEKARALDEAYDEYCRLRDAGQSVVPSEFCSRYPTYRRSLRRLIDVHDNLEQFPELEHDSWPECGKEFLGFEILHELGIGAIARVYLAAEHALGGRFVAIKVSLYGDDEADTLGKLSHKNVVPVHSVQVDPESGMTAVCMPYLGSATLADVLDLAFGENRPPQRADIIITAARERDFLAGFIDRAYVASETDRALCRGTYVDGVAHLGIQLAEALAYTHSQGILHRDLKPSNVLLAPSGQPMLLDFNLSCDIKLDVNRVGGTLPYMPPEQIREVHMPPEDSRPAGDPRSDIFSLGVILYELLSGRLPFGDPPANVSPKEAGTAYLAQQQQAPGDLTRLNPQVDQSLAETIGRCLQPDPAQRPESAAELAAQLRRRFALRSRFTRCSYRHRWMLSAVAVILLGAASITAAILLNRAPYSVRECDKAVMALREGRFSDGLSHIERSITKDPDSIRAKFVRARLYHVKGEFGRAASELQIIAEETEHPFLYECLAYSLLKDDQNRRAAAAYDLAMRHGKKKTPQLLVNQAYAFKNGGRSGGAELALDQAIELDPEFPPAYYLRALARLDLSSTIDEQKAVQLKIWAAEDIEQALKHGQSVYLEFDAARIKAAAAPHGSKYEDDVRHHLQNAVRLGLPGAMLDSISSFDAYREDEWFQDIIKASAAGSAKRGDPFVTPPDTRMIDVMLGL